MRVKIAVLGAGFCGLACAYRLSEYLERGIDLEISVFDPEEVASNASGISAGLLHVYGGAHAKLSRYGLEGLSSTLNLIEAVKAETGVTAALKTGLLRVAVSDRQKQDFFACSKRYSDVRWCEAADCQDMFPGVVAEPGIFIENAYVVNSRLYLEGLWSCCRKKGNTWHKRKVFSLEELEQFDAVIVAAGSSITSLPELSHLPIRPIKGQVLQIRWPEHLPLLKIPINSKAYFVQDSDGDTCTVGATFERNFETAEPDVETALAYLLPKMRDIFIDMKSVEVLACRSGIRAAAPDHMPLFGRESEKIWFLTGMGSKGLLYHAMYSKKIVDDVMSSLLPSLFS